MSTIRLPALVLLLGFCAAGLAAGAPLFDVQAKLQADAQLREAMVDLQAGFAKWKQAFNVKYSSEEEEAAAFSLWSERVLYMSEHNAKPNITFFMKMHERMAIDYAAQQAAARAASQPARMLLARATGLFKPKTALSSSPFRSFTLKDTSCPASLNWADQGVLTPVKNQGQCGSCWTFSSTGAIEAATAIATGQLPNLSEQQLVDCAKDGSNGCNGGWMGAAFAYVQKAGGITTEDNYPYTAADGQCQQDKASGSVAAQVAGYTDLPAGDEGALKAAVCNQPVSIALAGGSNAFQGYGGGVIEAGTDCDTTSVDHAVLAVGFGSDQGGDFWIVRNSWGPGWGEGGYVRIRMGSNVCQLVTDGPVVPQVAGGNVPAPPSPPPSPPAPGPNCKSTYTIQSGDTLFNIATANGVTLQQIESANPQISNFDLIQVGDVINIPCQASVSASPLTCSKQYKVQAGDTFFNIASKNGITPQKLQDANPQVANPSLIFPGTILNIPPCTLKQSIVSARNSRAQCKKASYKVVAGDYLYKVANKFSCTVGDLLFFNPSLAKGAHLKVGETITVFNCPVAARAASAFLSPVHLSAGVKHAPPPRSG